MSIAQLRAGDWVQVRSREEILATLDEHGRLDGMPFMPEMLACCGKTLQVAKRAHKTCDTILNGGARRLEQSVLLVDSRCDGSAHGGCEAACLVFWKDAWLKPADAAGRRAGSRRRPRLDGPGCNMEQLIEATRQGDDPEKGPCYACQATHLLNATQPMSPYDPRQYIEDLRSGNVDLLTMLRGLVYRAAVFTSRRVERIGRRVGFGDAPARALLACYDAMQRLLPNGVPFPRRRGTIPAGQPTPHADIGELRPGSWVRVKPYHEILATLNTENKTRGLYFDGEHVPYCGKQFRVRSLVQHIVDERNGYMLHFKSPSIILDSVHCTGTYSDNRMFCPRAIYHYWRPVWLDPVDRVDATEQMASHKTARSV